jgi:hypothetical protein
VRVLPLCIGGGADPHPLRRRRAGPGSGPDGPRSGFDHFLFFVSVHANCHHKWLIFCVILIVSFGVDIINRLPANTINDFSSSVVTAIWQREAKGTTPMERWQNKIRSLWRSLRGWDKNMNRAYKKEKSKLHKK